jgi:hypothetical protein
MLESSSKFLILGLQNFAIMKTIIHEQNIHDTDHKFVLTDTWNINICY